MSVTYADFGPLVVEPDVDRAVYGTLRKWMDHYLGKLESERNFERGYLPRPKPGAYTNTLGEDEYPDNFIPGVIVTTARADTAPLKDGSGNYRATFSTTVAAVVRGQKPQATRDLAAYYGGTIRRILAQQQDLGGFASEVVPQRFGIQPVADPTGAGRYLAAGVSSFSVLVDSVLNEQGGPLLPPDDSGEYPNPNPDDPGQTYQPPVEVQTVGIEVVGASINQGLGD